MMQKKKINICKRLGVNTIVATSLDIIQSLLTFVPENDQAWLKTMHTDYCKPTYC